MTKKKRTQSIQHQLIRRLLLLRSSGFHRSRHCVCYQRVFAVVAKRISNVSSVKPEVGEERAGTSNDITSKRPLSSHPATLP